MPEVKELVEKMVEEFTNHMQPQDRCDYIPDLVWEAMARVALEFCKERHWLNKPYNPEIADLPEEPK